MRRSFQSCSEACESSKPQFLPVFLSKGLSAVRRAGFLINIAGSIALKGRLSTQSPPPNLIISINKEYGLRLCLTVKRAWSQKPAGIEEEPFSTEAID